MFQKVHPSKLINGDLCRIDIYSHTYKATFSGYTYDGYCRFTNVKRIDNVRCKDFCIKDRYVYKFVSHKQKIQDEMERRALNTIISNLICHEFDWYS
jgi:hypothetical protein